MRCDGPSASATPRTLALSRGAYPYWFSEQMGYSSCPITLDVYTHYTTRNDVHPLNSRPQTGRISAVIARRRRSERYGAHVTGDEGQPPQPPSRPKPSDREADEHWFSGKDLEVLVYKINRRPLGDPMLFEPPRDFLAHVTQVMSGDLVAKSGRSFQREWRIGNLSRSDGVITGMLGWSRSGETLSNIYEAHTKTWRDTVVPNDVAAVAPFTVLADSRYFGVLRHTSFDEKTVAKVFAELLNRGEGALPAPTTAWSVDPVGDRQHFDEWLRSVDRVDEMKFIFKRPNPDAEAGFQFLFERLDKLGAGQIVDRVTPRDKEAGLNKGGIRRIGSARRTSRRP